MRNFQNFELILQDAHEQPVPNRAAEAGGLQGARFLHPLLHLLEHGQALGRPQTPAISEVHGAFVDAIQSWIHASMNCASG